MSNDEIVTETFLPDFCSVRLVFTVVVMAQLLAFVLAMSPSATGDRWLQLSLTSLFIQWVALTNCAVLCVLSRWLRRFNKLRLAFVCFMVVMLVTLLISEASYSVSRALALDRLLPDSWHIEFLLRNLGISGIIAAVSLRYFYLQHQLKLSITARSKARIEALQARIRPHFLFNSMNTIASLTRSKPALAEEVVEDLADLFRASLAVDDSEVRLSQELHLCQRYLNIEKTRLGDRLQVNWSIDDSVDGVFVPTLSIQPLIENAIYHGIEPRIEGGCIAISGQINAGYFELRVSNPLPVSTLQSDRQSHHMALENIRDRLASLYEGLARLDIDNTDQQFTVLLVIPLRHQEQQK